jgi:glycosyltransferase involved in cell wall biosynthesis
VRILLASPRFAPQVGGAETWTHAVSKGLIVRGHQVHVITRAARGLSESATIDGIAVRRVAGGRWAFASAIAHAVRDQRPDVAVAQYTALAPAVVAGRRNRIPVVGIVHDVYGFRASVRTRGPLMGPVRHVVFERSLRWVGPDAFLVPSRTTGQALRALAGSRPVTVVPAGADHVPILETPEGADGARIVFVGRLVRTKGAADLVGAVRLLVARGYRPEALVVGTGPELERVRAGALGLPVAFAGAIDDDALDGAVRSALVLALPSTREGWGLAITEAAARGVPYVAYDIPAVREQHDDVGGGILVPPDVDALADALASLLDDPEAARALGRRGLEAVRGRTWAAAAAVAEEALARAVERAQAG